MKVLIGVMSCVRDSKNGCHDACRQTWITQMIPGLDYKFFVGNGNYDLRDDEIQLDVPDDYEHLPEKSQAIRKWALEHEYEFVFKADRDTYLVPKRLLASGFEKFDYTGHFPLHPQEGFMPPIPDARGVYAYASGGCGYWTGRRAMELIVAAPLDWKRLDNRGQPAEDLWIPNILVPAGVNGYHDPRYQFKGAELWNKTAISVHLSRATGSYQPQWMVDCHQSHILREARP